MNKSIAVLGLGKYGMSLVRELNKIGVDVLAVDRDESVVKEIADYCTEAVCADLEDENSLLSLGLKDMDIVVVAIGDNLEASIMSVLVAKEQGVPRILAKSSSERMSVILNKTHVAVADTFIDAPVTDCHAGLLVKLNVAFLLCGI